MMELALVENLQRKDLTPFEEADGLQVLAEKYAYTHEAMAEKVGKSRSSITETLSLASMPEDVRQLCRLADIQSKSVLLQIVRQGDREKMAALVERLGRDGATRVEARRLARKDDARRGRGPPEALRLPVQARRGATSRSTCSSSAPQVEREEIIRTLEGILESLRKERVSARPQVILEVCRQAATAMADTPIFEPSSRAPRAASAPPSPGRLRARGERSSWWRAARIACEALADELGGEPHALVLPLDLAGPGAAEALRGDVEAPRDRRRLPRELRGARAHGALRGAASRGDPGDARRQRARRGRAHPRLPAGHEGAAAGGAS